MTVQERPPRWFMGVYWSKRRLPADDFVGVAVSTLELVRAGHPEVDAWYEGDDGPVPQRGPLELTETGVAGGRPPGSGLDVRIHAWNGRLDAAVLYSGMAGDHGSEIVPHVVKVEMPGPNSESWDDVQMVDLLGRLIEASPADWAVIDSTEMGVRPASRRASIGWRSYIRDTPGEIEGLPPGVSSRPFANGCLIGFEHPASVDVDPAAAREVADRLDAVWSDVDS